MSPSELTRLVLSHPKAHLILVTAGSGWGKYPKVYPGELFVNDEEVALLTRGQKTLREPSEILEYLSALDPIAEAVAILKASASHSEPFCSTSKDEEIRFISPEKSVFAQDNPFYLGDFRVSFRFYVTSYIGSISMRVQLCPEACYPRVSDIPTNIRSSDFEKIGEFAWGQNGSGFNRKYQEGIKFLHDFREGRWDEVKPCMQENRSQSISQGLPTTRFWSAQLTFPEKAHDKATFPLFSAKRMPVISDCPQHRNVTA